MKKILLLLLLAIFLTVGCTDTPKDPPKFTGGELIQHVLSGERGMVVRARSNGYCLVRFESDLTSTDWFHDYELTEIIMSGEVEPTVIVTIPKNVTNEELITLKAQLTVLKGRVDILEANAE